MQFVAVVLLITALLGAGLGRWTKLHPLLAGGVGAIPAALLAFLAAAGTMSPAAVGFGIVGWLIAAAAGAFGAFMGWLRRENIERTE